MDMPYSKGWYKVRLKPSGKWEARWADSEGKARGKCFNLKSQADKHARDEANRVVNVGLGLERAKKDIHAAVEAFYMAKMREESSNTVYQDHFRALFDRHPEISDIDDFTDSFFVSYIKELKARKNANGSPRHRPGGINHITKTFRAFCKFCVRQKWMTYDPFLSIPHEKTEKGKGRALSAEEFERLVKVGDVPIDLHLNRALRFGNATFLRISMVWKLTPKDFREPNQLWVEGIKGQAPEWKTLHPDAVAILRELPPCGPDERLFGRWWPKVDYMRKAVRYKADRSGLAGIRFHDASKVTAVTNLSLKGYSSGEIAHVSNTSKATLDIYYIKVEKARAVNRYVADLHRTYTGPGNDQNKAEGPTLQAIAHNTAEVESSTVKA